MSLLSLTRRVFFFASMKVAAMVVASVLAVAGRGDAGGCFDDSAGADVSCN